jgi:hypothetical protein
MFKWSKKHNLVASLVLTVLLASFLLVPLTSAQNEETRRPFTVILEPISDSITLDGQASFKLTINNPNKRAETFRLSSTDVEWSVQSDPLYHYFSGIEVPARSSETVKLLFKPTVTFPPSLRNIRINVESEDYDQKEVLSTFIEIRSEYPLIREYLAAVSKIVEIPSEVDPRQELLIKVNLLNRNPKNITDMKVVLSTVSSDLIQEEIITTLAPLESKSVSANVTLDPLTKPLKDTLKIVMIVDGRRLEPTIFEKFGVIEYSNIKATESETSSSFFKWVNETTYVNDGNVGTTALIESETNILKTLFVTSKPKAFTITRNGERFKAWELTLKPQESVTIRTVESYRSLFVLIILGIIGIVLYRFFQSPVSIIKESNAISYKEGGVSELKVVLRVKNRSSNPYVRVTVMDRIPMMANVEHDTMGTLKPSTIFNSGQGSVIKWEIENLDRNEERILAYKIKLKLSILGTFALPKSSLKFYTEKNVKFITHSNVVTVKP